jgi:hypothetical protein
VYRYHISYDWNCTPNIWEVFKACIHFKTKSILITFSTVYLFCRFYSFHIFSTHILSILITICIDMIICFLSLQKYLFVYQYCFWYYTLNVTLLCIWPKKKQKQKKICRKLDITTFNYTMTFYKMEVNFYLINFWINLSTLC